MRLIGHKKIEKGRINLSERIVKLLIEAVKYDPSYYIPDSGPNSGVGHVNWTAVVKFVTENMRERTTIDYDNI